MATEVKRGNGWNGQCMSCGVGGDVIVIAQKPEHGSMWWESRFCPSCFQEMTEKARNLIRRGEWRK